MEKRPGGACPSRSCPGFWLRLPSRGCKPESQKFPSENIIREIFECFAIRYGLSCMFWQLNRAVWGFAALLPEINCLPTTLASPGFAGQTEKSGVWAYNPNTGYSCGKMHPNR